MNITPEADAFILKLLRKNPKDRPRDMNEVYAEFRNIKIFREDPGELAERKREEEEKAKLASVDKRLDSRLDAERTAKGIVAPVKEKKKKPTMSWKELKAQEEAEKKAKEMQQQPPQPGYQPPMPGYMPQQPMPGYMPPQPMPYQQQGYYPQPMPPQYPPQIPQQMPPGYPPQQMPPQQMPPQQPPMPQPPMPQQPCLLYTSPSPRDATLSRMPSSA